MPDCLLPPADFIKTKRDLNRLVQTLQQTSLVAVDTESNSLYAYQERVCLIQISTRDKDYIVDPLVIKDLSPLGTVFESPEIEKVFHAAEYDIMCMKRDFGFTFRNVFDTMMAARICGKGAVGLGNLLEEYAGVKPDKSHQRDDWGKRPLPKESLRYAQMDTHYLPMLRDALGELLTDLGRSREAHEVFEETSQAPPARRRGQDPDGFWRIGKPNQLSRREMMVLREIYQLREEIASDRDVPPFKVLNNKTLVALARKMPQTRSELKDVRGFSARQLKRYGTQILEAIARGKAAKHLPSPPDNDRPPPDIMERYAALHAWRKQRAQERGVESDVIISKQALWMLAYEAPQDLQSIGEVKGIGPWRLGTYGEEILDVLRNYELFKE